jgi:hypothetical protein
VARLIVEVERLNMLEKRIAERREAGYLRRASPRKSRGWSESSDGQNKLLSNGCESMISASNLNQV